MSPSQARVYLSDLRGLVSDVEGLEIFPLPPFPTLPVCAQTLARSNLNWGVQNVHGKDRGAYTGEVSAPMLADLGCKYVLVGHYERHRDYGDTNEMIGAKTRAPQRWQMVPILCLGESKKGNFNKHYVPCAGSSTV